MKRLIYKFDMIVYRLFYWRWNKRIEDDKNIRELFIEYLTNYNKGETK